MRQSYPHSNALYTCTNSYVENPITHFLIFSDPPGSYPSRPVTYLAEEGMVEPAMVPVACRGCC